jgi:23S rRNA G2069 N7-methylase RlmK/C1962 C5-methylase RlmI
VELAILDSNGTVIASSNQAGLIPEFLQRQLAAGTYRIRVRRVAASTNYNLVLSPHRSRKKSKSKIARMSTGHI